MLSISRYRQDVRTVLNALQASSEEKREDVELLGPAANVVFLPVIGLWVIASVVFLIFEGSGNSAGTFGDSFNVLNALLSGLALGAIALSLFLQRAELKATLNEMKETTKALEEQARYLKFERDRNVREFAATFQSERLKKARSTAYILRAPFFKDHDFRRVLAKQWISAEDVVLPENMIDFIKDANEGRVSEDEVNYVKDHTWHISDFVEYYSTLYNHCESLGIDDREKIARALGEKYIWSYWRGMLLLHAFEVAKLYDQEISTDEERAQFPKPHWIHDIVQFDRWVMDARYRPLIHPRERMYCEGDIEYNDEYLADFSGVNQTQVVS